MQVMLSNRGNPDRYQNAEQPLPGTPHDRWVDVASYAEASTLCRAYITRWDLGGGNWTGGRIICDLPEGARVAYNGRVFRGAEYVPNAEVLFEPR